eukprot:scaffold15341_cov64-Phaeocystis_antarctica.AAC.2
METSARGRTGRRALGDVLPARLLGPSGPSPPTLDPQQPLPCFDAQLPALAVYSPSPAGTGIRRHAAWPYHTARTGRHGIQACPSSSHILDGR